MPGETIKCPHCECKVKIADVENEDGNCPECGRPVMASSLQDDFDNDGIDEEEYGTGMDDEYSGNEDEDWDKDDSDEEQPDILDELNDEIDDMDEDGAPIKKRHSSGMGFRAPKSSSPSGGKRGKKK